MAGSKRADQLGVGEEFEPYEFTVTAEFNQQYLEAQEDFRPRYLQETEGGAAVVHPGLLINYSSVTRGPSFYLPSNMAAVVAKDEIEYLNPGRVGKTFTVHWRVVDTYEKRGRPYQVTDISVVDEDGLKILRRRMNCTYITGKE